MQNHKNPKKYISLVFASLLILAVGCGDPIPMEEMGIAKVAIARAETVKAKQYSPQNYEAAQKALLDAHAAVENDKMGDAKEKAVEAKKLADAAYDEAAPKLAQDTRAEAEKAIQAAVEANAEQFAPEDLAASRTTLVEGDKFYDTKDYLSSYHLFEESREKAKRALTTSEAYVETMRRELTEVDDTIAAAIQAGAETSAPDTLQKAKTEAGHARGDLENKKLKSAYTNLEAAKVSSREALQIAQKQRAQELLLQAERDVAAAEAKLNALKENANNPKGQAALASSEEAQQALQGADDNLTAAKEALAAAHEADRNQAYAEAGTQAEEASRLSKIMADSLSGTEVLLSQGKDSDATKDEDTRATKGTTDAKDRKGWKTYKVRYIPENRDCLWKIAGYKKIYNNARLWPKIYRANKSQIKNPDLIYPGQVFKIPPKKSKGD